MVTTIYKIDLNLIPAPPTCTYVLPLLQFFDLKFLPQNSPFPFRPATRTPILPFLLLHLILFLYLFLGQGKKIRAHVAATLFPTCQVTANPKNVATCVGSDWASRDSVVQGFRNEKKRSACTVQGSFLRLQPREQLISGDRRY